MALGITPVVEGDVPPGTPFPKFIQFRASGSNLGDQGVQVVDIVGDPTRVQVTRGVGENSHVITMRLLEPPAPSAPVVGWHDPITDIGGVAAQANTGTGTFQFGLDIIINRSMFAGVVGYTSGTVVWNSTWTPVGADPAPTIIQHPGGVVEVEWPIVGGGFPSQSSEGLLELTATVDGSPISNVIEVSGSPAFYFQFAWGPQP